MGPFSFSIFGTFWSQKQSASLAIGGGGVGVVGTWTTSSETVGCAHGVDKTLYGRAEIEKRHPHLDYRAIVTKKDPSLSYLSSNTDAQLWLLLRRFRFSAEPHRH